MKKEDEQRTGIELELKLPVNIPLDQMRENLTSLFGLGGKRTRELTVMYDNDRVISSRRLQGNLKEASGYQDLAIPSHGIQLSVQNLNELVSAIQAVGYEISMPRQDTI